MNSLLNTSSCNNSRYEDSRKDVELGAKFMFFKELLKGCSMKNLLDTLIELR
jgi:hypothetical protein